MRWKLPFQIMMVRITLKTKDLCTSISGYIAVTVSLSSESLSLPEDAGLVMVCATLSGGAVEATQRPFDVTLTTIDDTGTT